MRSVTRLSVILVAFAVGLAALPSLALADCNCRVCKYILFNGTYCSFVQPRQIGNCQCVDTDQCHAYGDECGGIQPPQAPTTEASALKAPRTKVVADTRCTQRPAASTPRIVLNK